MKTAAYTLNKGVNRPIEFRGLKAQYIWWLAGGIVGLLLAFAVLYITGVNPYVCLIIIGIAGTILFRQVYWLSRHYGQYGLMKKTASQRIPHRIRADTRQPFLLISGHAMQKEQSWKEH